MSAFGVGLLRLDAKGRAAGPSRTASCQPTSCTTSPPPRCRTGKARSGSRRAPACCASRRPRAGLRPSPRAGLGHDPRTECVAQPSGSQVLWLATEAGISRTVLDGSAWSTASLMGSRLARRVRGADRTRWPRWRATVGRLQRRRARAVRGRTLAAVQRGQRPPADQQHQHDPRVARGGWPANAVARHLGWRPVAGGRRTAFHAPGNALAKAHRAVGADVLQRTVHGREEFWVGTRLSGAWRLRDGRWEAMPAPGIDGQWRVGRIIEQRDRNGRDWLWASTDSGLARFDGKAWTLFDSSTGFPDDQLAGLRLYPDAGAGRSCGWAARVSASFAWTSATRCSPGSCRPTCRCLPILTPTARFARRTVASTCAAIPACSNSRPIPRAVMHRGCSAAATAWSTRNATAMRNSSTRMAVSGPAPSAAAVYDPSRVTADTQPKPLRVTGMHVDGRPQPGHATSGSRRCRHDRCRIRPAVVGSRSRVALPHPARRPGKRTDAMDDAAVTQLQRVAARRLPPAHRGTRPCRQCEQAHRHPDPRHRALVAASVGLCRRMLALLLLGYAAAMVRTRVLRAQREALEQRVAERHRRTRCRQRTLARPVLP